MPFPIKQRSLAYPFATLFLLFHSIVARSLPITTEGLDTRVQIEGNKLFIRGGKIQGTNQFNSFKEFNIPKGFEAIFQNNPSISDIMVRVTGENISNIDGTLTADANFWFLNPNGVIFGPSAKINIGGTFNVIAGGDLRFADGSEFGVRSSDTFLTESKPIGVNFPNGRPPAPVVILDSGHKLNERFFLGQLTEGRDPNNGIKINQINILANEVNLDGGMISAEKLNFVAVKQGTVKFNLNDSFDVSQVTDFGNIILKNKSLLDVTSVDGFTPAGSAQLTAKNIDISGNSVIISQNKSSQIAKEITVIAIQSLTLQGKDKQRIKTGIYSESDGLNPNARGAKININTPFLSMKTAEIRSNNTTFNSAPGGDININADRVELFNATIQTVNSNFTKTGNISINAKKVKLTELNEKPSTIRSLTYGFGDGGHIYLSVNKLEINNGSVIDSVVTPPELNAINPNLNILGEGGNIFIEAKDTVKIDGTGLIEITDFIESNPELEEITLVPQNSSIFAATGNITNAGNVSIKTQTLSLTNQGEIRNLSVFSGQPGNLNIEVSKQILLQNGFIENATVIPRTDLVEVGFTSQNPTAKSNRLTITTPNFKLIDSQISVSNGGTNAAGIANINADTIRLENSTITAQTSAGSGQLNINSKDFRATNSQITTSAEAAGTGGDININSDIFFANSSSQITATAVQGNGGNISLRGNDGIFISADSIVSADSEFGADGVVNIEGITSEQIGNELSFYNIRKAEESQQQQPTTFTSDCVEESLTATSGVNPKYDPYRDPDSPLSGLTPPEQTSEVDNELLKHYATGIIMAKVPQDESLLLDYLREHFEDVRVSPSGVIQTGEIKNLEKIEIPADWFKRSFNYLEICQ